MYLTTKPDRPLHTLFRLTLQMSSALLLIALLVTGCSNAVNQRNTITFWAMGSEGQVVERMIPAFERENPGIRVRIQQIPWSAAHEKLLTAYAGGVMPDIFQLGNTWIPEFVALSAVEPLDRNIATSAAVDQADYFRGIAATNTLNNRTYGVPWYVDTRLLFYRADLLKKAGYTKPPETWAEWFTVMQGVRAVAGKRNYAILLPADEWAPLVILALQRGALLLKDDDQYANFNTPAFREAFEYYVKLFKTGLAPPLSGAQISNLYQEFARGYFAFYISGPWNIGEFSQRLPASMQQDWMTAPMPAPDKNYPGVSLAGGASLGIAKTSRHKEAAWKLIEYLSEPSRQVEFYKLTGDLPARMSAWQDEALRDDDHVRAFWKQLQHVQVTPKIPEWEQIASKITDYMEAVVRGQMSIDEALPALDHDVNQLLEKRRWILSHIPAKVSSISGKISE